MEKPQKYICEIVLHEGQQPEYPLVPFLPVDIYEISVVEKTLVFIYLYFVFFFSVSTTPGNFVYLKETSEVLVIQNDKIESGNFLNALRCINWEHQWRSSSFVMDSLVASIDTVYKDKFKKHILPKIRKKNVTRKYQSSDKRNHIALVTPIYSIYFIEGDLLEYKTLISTVNNRNAMYAGDKELEFNKFACRKISPAQKTSSLPPYMAFCCRKTPVALNSTCIDCKTPVYAEIKSITENTVSILIQIKIIPSEVWNLFFQNYEENCLVANPILLEQLQLKSGSKVDVNCYHGGFHLPQIIILHTEKAYSDRINVAIKEMFLNSLLIWLEQTSNVVLNQGTFLKLKLAGIVYRVAVEMIGIQESVFSSISKDTINNIEVQIVADNEEYDIEDLMEVAPVRPWAGIFCFDSGLKHILDGFEKKCRARQNSITSKSVRSLLSPKFHNMLIICKSVNTRYGKASLCHEVSSYFGNKRYHIENVSCVTQRGKKLESIRQQWQACYERAVFNQPALIIFHDLDDLIQISDTHEDAPSKNVYCRWLADIFQELLETVANEKHCVSIIVTVGGTGLHEHIIPQCNCHLFTYDVILEKLHPEKIKKRIDVVYFENELKQNIQGRLKTLLCTLGKFDQKELEKIMKKVDILKVFDVETLKIADSVTQKLQAENEVCADRKTNDFSFQDNKIREESSGVLKYFGKVISQYRLFSVTHNLSTVRPIKYNDIGGLKKAKETLKEMLIWPAIYSELFSKCPLDPPSGILLFGMPGTAKTTLAISVAYESKINFISIKGPELLSKYVGNSEANIRNVFVEADSRKPCLIFFDELDSLAPKRGHDNTGVTDRVVNQLLTQLDGIETRKGIYVLAATSRPDLIDPALLRPGRFDKCVHCPMPSESERYEILNILINDLNVEEKIDFRFLARETENFSGADVKALLFNAQVLSIYRYMDEMQEVANSGQTSMGETNVKVQFLLSSKPF